MRQVCYRNEGTSDTAVPLRTSANICCGLVIHFSVLFVLLEKLNVALSRKIVMDLPPYSSSEICPITTKCTLGYGCHIFIQTPTKLSGRLGVWLTA